MAVTGGVWEYRLIGARSATQHVLDGWQFVQVMPPDRDEFRAREDTYLVRRPRLGLP